VGGGHAVTCRAREAGGGVGPPPANCLRALTPLEPFSTQPWRGRGPRPRPGYERYDTFNAVSSTTNDVCLELFSVPVNFRVTFWPAYAATL